MVAETAQPYSYTEDDPVNQTDPLGDSAKKCSNGFCLGVSGSGTNVTGIVVSLTFPIEPYAAQVYVGDSLLVEVLTPSREAGGYDLADCAVQAFTALDAADDPEGATLTILGIPDGGLNLPNGSVINAFLEDPSNQIIDQQQVVVRAHAALGGFWQWLT